MHFRAHDSAAERFPPATRVKPTHREKVGGRMSDGLKLNRPRQNRKRCILGCTTAPSEMDASRLTAGSWRSRALREWCDLGRTTAAIPGRRNLFRIVASVCILLHAPSPERTGGPGRGDGQRLKRSIPYRVVPRSTWREKFLGWHRGNAVWHGSSRMVIAAACSGSPLSTLRSLLHEYTCVPYSTARGLKSIPLFTFSGK